MRKIEKFDYQQFKDARGAIHYNNEVDLSETKRFYSIHASPDHVTRAWQGHQREVKWFYVQKGKFCLNFVAIDNWVTPSKDCKKEVFHLSCHDNQLIRLPGGYASGIKALEENSILTVFSNFNLKETKEDDFRYDLNKFEFESKQLNK